MRKLNVDEVMVLTCICFMPAFVRQDRCSLPCPFFEKNSLDVFLLSYKKTYVCSEAWM